MNTPFLRTRRWIGPLLQIVLVFIIDPKIGILSVPSTGQSILCFRFWSISDLSNMREGSYPKVSVPSIPFVFFEISTPTPFKVLACVLSDMHRSHHNSNCIWVKDEMSTCVVTEWYLSTKYTNVSLSEGMCARILLSLSVVLPFLLLLPKAKPNFSLHLCSGYTNIVDIWK